MARYLQSLRSRVALVVGGWVCISAVHAGLYAAFPPGLDHPTIVTSAVAFVTYWALASRLMLRLHPHEWLFRTDRLRLLQLNWALGWLMFAVHVALAFDLGHGWSHRAAFEHTARTAGVGEGVYVNYLFGLVWLADAVWLAAWPDGYARRPRWVGWAVHGFLAFITFNATVVYGTGPARWLGVLAFAVLAMQLVRRR